MMPYPFIVESIPLQYRHNNRIASCCNYRNENFQYRPTLLDDQLMMLITYDNNCYFSLMIQLI